MTKRGVSYLNISVFARHSDECPKKDNPQWRRCNCRKSIYVREGGKTTYVSAQTRSWEQAEKLAQRMREDRDPVRIEERKAAAELEAQRKPIGEALDQWLAGRKKPRETSIEAYRSTTRRIKRWAADNDIVYVGQVTPTLLDEWRSSWDPDSKEKENRLALSTQGALLTRIKMFFRWATGMGYVERNPTLLLEAITTEESQTWPLTPEQFDEVIAATYKYDKDCRFKSAKVGVFLRALFHLQRRTGLRVGDALALPKATLVGSRIRLDMQKRGNDHSCVVPDYLIEQLNSLPPWNTIHPDYFFWSKRCTIEVNTNKWCRKIKRINNCLAFKDEEGKPMEFRSHMLRDTFAVEMLLTGMPLEKVSKLLGHKSIAVTERYYAKWVKSRLRQLEGDVVAAMRKMGLTVSV